MENWTREFPSPPSFPFLSPCWVYTIREHRTGTGQPSLSLSLQSGRERPPLTTRGCLRSRKPAPPMHPIHPSIAVIRWPEAQSRSGSKPVVLSRIGESKEEGHKRDKTRNKCWCSDTHIPSLLFLCFWSPSPVSKSHLVCCPPSL